MQLVARELMRKGMQAEDYLGQVRSMKDPGSMTYERLAAFPDIARAQDQLVQSESPSWRQMCAFMPVPCDGTSDVGCSPVSGLI